MSKTDRRTRFFNAFRVLYLAGRTKDEETRTEFRSLLVECANVEGFDPPSAQTIGKVLRLSAFLDSDVIDCFSAWWDEKLTNDRAFMSLLARKSKDSGLDLAAELNPFFLEQATNRLNRWIHSVPTE